MSHPSRDETNDNQVYIDVAKSSHDFGYAEALADVLALPEMQEEQRDVRFPGGAVYYADGAPERNSLRRQIKLGIESLSQPGTNADDNASGADTQKKVKEACLWELRSLKAVNRYQMDDGAFAVPWEDIEKRIKELQK